MGLRIAFLAAMRVVALAVLAAATSGCLGSDSDGDGWRTASDRRPLPIVDHCTDGPEAPITEARLDDDVNSLRLVTAHAGGCANHRYRACWVSHEPGQQGRVRLAIQHDDRGDACEAWIQQPLEVDLSEVATRTGGAAVLIQVGSFSVPYPDL